MNSLEFNPANNPYVWADVLRVIFGFIPAAVLLGLTLAVVFSYYRAWRIARYRSVRSGLLPQHVWLIGISYIIILMDSVYSLIERLHTRLNPHTFLVLPGYVCGCVSLLLVLRFERLRYASESGAARDLGPTDGKE